MGRLFRLASRVAPARRRWWTPRWRRRTGACRAAPTLLRCAVQRRSLQKRCSTDYGKESQLACIAYEYARPLLITFHVLQLSQT
jgi:hypothetical protein